MPVVDRFVGAAVDRGLMNEERGQKMSDANYRGTPQTLLQLVCNTQGLDGRRYHTPTFVVSSNYEPLYIT